MDGPCVCHVVVVLFDSIIEGQMNDINIDQDVHTSMSLNSHVVQ